MKTLIFSHIIILVCIIPLITQAQVVTITGHISDKMNGQSLENVSVFEENSGIGTISNQNGFYKLILPKGDLDLKFTDQGFMDFGKAMAVNSDTTLVVKLQPRTNSKNKQKNNNQIQAKGNRKSQSRSGLYVLRK